MIVEKHEQRQFKNPIIQFVFNLFLGLDQLLNVLLLGDPDESISGRCGRAIKYGTQKFWVGPLADAIDWFFLTVFREANHIMNSVEPEERPHEKELWKWYHEVEGGE